jgi:hypothetical protein
VPNSKAMQIWNLVTLVLSLYVGIAVPVSACASGDAFPRSPRDSARMDGCERAFAAARSGGRGLPMPARPSTLPTFQPVANSAPCCNRTEQGLRERVRQRANLPHATCRKERAGMRRALSMRRATCTEREPHPLGLVRSMLAPRRHAGGGGRSTLCCNAVHRGATQHTVVQRSTPSCNAAHRRATQQDSTPCMHECTLPHTRARAHTRTHARTHARTLSHAIHHDTLFHRLGLRSTL